MLFKGHYSVIEPDGSMRTVEYSAGPKSGFTAVVNNDEFPMEVTAEDGKMEDKALRDYDRYYDFSEDEDIETSFKTNEKKRNRNPYDKLLKDYSFLKRPKYPSDSEPSEYTHSFTIKHPRDELEPEASAQSHVGFKFDPNCKTRYKKIKNNLYNSGNLDFRRQKYPSLTSDTYDNGYDKYVSDASNMEKLIHKYKHNDEYIPPKPEEYDWPSTKHSYSGVPESPQVDNTYNDYTPLRPKKKYKPVKPQEHYTNEELDDYILVPKRKHKNRPRVTEPEYEPETEDEVDESYEDDRYRRPPRTPAHKEVVRKIIKKKKPVINILDIFDI